MKKFKTLVLAAGLAAIVALEQRAVMTIPPRK